MEIEARLREGVIGGQPALAPGCRGTSPAVREYRPVAPGVAQAVFGEDTDVASGWQKWRASLGDIDRARFYSLPGEVVRYEIRGRNAGRLEYRVGYCSSR